MYLDRYPLDVLSMLRHYREKVRRLASKMKILWFVAAAASMYGAIAGAFLEEGNQFTAIAFALLAIIFCLAAYRDISQS